jgi:hypothetical protein
MNSWSLRETGNLIKARHNSEVFAVDRNKQERRHE